jgi:uncharacterized protein (TIGR02145 family)
MKKLYTILALVVTLFTTAQAPQGFNYQATVRNSSGALITNQNVLFKFNIMLNSQTSLPIFTETHFAPTDDIGQVNLVIGQGTATTGTFSSINWAAGSYFLGIELNTGAGYISMGTTQLLSVPFALYANSSGNSNFNFPNGTNIGDTLNWIWNGSAWVATPTVSTSQLPVVNTTVATFTTNSPSSGGTIISDGGFSITSKGVCWSVSPNPTIANNITNEGNGASNFTSFLSNLLPTTTYYYRAYATNSIGTGYGITYTFTTLGSPYPVGTVFCASGATTVVNVTNPTTGKIWMDRNLGATQAATSSTDINSYGDLYQWGRRSDGHQCRTSPTTATLSSVDQPANGSFILPSNSPVDWRSPQNNNLWQGVNGINNPCPSGYRLPTETELNAERTSWSQNNSTGAFASPLKLPMAGFRQANDGSLVNIGVGNYWSSTVSGSNSHYLYFNSSNAFIGNPNRAYGYSVRCIKN